VCRLERHDRQEGVLGAEDAVNVSEDLIEVGEYVAVGGQDTIWKRMGHKARKIFLKRLSIVIFYPALDLKNLGNAIGDGAILEILAREYPLSLFYAIEISDSGIERILNRKITRLAEAVKFDGYEIPYPDQHFDLSYCSHVIEHVENPRMLIRELKRVSKKIIFEVPIDFSKHLDNNYRHFFNYGHINIYTPSLFRFLLRSEGLVILSDRYTKLSRNVIRFNWYNNLKFNKTIWNETIIIFYHQLRWIRLLLNGLFPTKEWTSSAYTCLVERQNEFAQDPFKLASNQ